MHYLISVIVPLFLAAFATAALDELPGSFEISGDSGVPVMHAALLSNGKVAFIDKIEDRVKILQPNGSAAYTCVYDPATQIAFSSNLLDKIIWVYIDSVGYPKTIPSRPVRVPRLALPAMQSTTVTR